MYTLERSEIDNFLPSLEERQLAPHVWNEVCAFADTIRKPNKGERVNDVIVLWALNNLYIAINDIDAEWINLELRFVIDTLIQDIMENIGGISPDALNYIADYVFRVVSYYQRNPSFLPENE